MRKFKEHYLQKTCVTWFRLRFPKLKTLLFSVPNGAFLNGAAKNRIRQWKRLESEGALSGVADLIFLFPSNGFHGLCIEMKNPNGKGTQTPTQKVFQNEVEKHGFRYEIIDSFDGFQNLIETYLNLKTEKK